jgi:hypothetical protein
MHGLPVHELPGEHACVRRRSRQVTVRPRRQLGGTPGESENERGHDGKQRPYASALEPKFVWGMQPSP